MKSKILIFFIILINHINTFTLDKTYQEFYAEQKVQRQKKTVTFQEDAKCIICNKKIEYEYLGHDLNAHIAHYNLCLTKHEYKPALEESYNLERYISFIMIDNYLKSSALQIQQILNVKSILFATRDVLRQQLMLN